MITSGRGPLLFVVPLLLLGILVGQQLWGWLPADGLGATLNRVVGLCFGLWLFAVAFGTEARSQRDLARTPVVCVACGQTTDVVSWQTRGRCPSCRHEEYEYHHQAVAFARYLPGAVVCEGGAPRPAAPTPIARPPRPARGSLGRPVDLACTRLGLQARKRIKRRMGAVLAARDGRQRF